LDKKYISILQKIELKINEKDEVVILCPTSEGKMVKLIKIN